MTLEDSKKPEAAAPAASHGCCRKRSANSELPNRSAFELSQLVSCAGLLRGFLKDRGILGL